MADTQAEQSLRDMGTTLGTQVLGGETTLDQVAADLRATLNPGEAKKVYGHARKKVAEQILDKDSALVSDPD